VREASRGVSRLEVLTVVAIIAVVAAVFLPMRAVKQESRRQTECSANLRVIGAAIAMYEKDHDERVLPCAETWWRPLRNYLRAKARSDKLVAVLVCPSTPREIGLPPEPWGDAGTLRSAAGVSGYGYSVMLGGVPCPNEMPSDYGPPKRLSQVAYPGRTVRIAEMWRITSNDGCGKAYPPSYQALHNGVIFAEGLSPQFVLPPGWHNGRSLVLWVDGHVTAMPTSQPRIPAEDPPPVWQTGVMENDPADKWFTTSAFKGG